MTDVSCHQCHEMLESIGIQQCMTLFLPPYNPGLIRLNTSKLKLKAFRRQYCYGVDELSSSIHNMSFYHVFSYMLT